jgi:Na+-translocating ferredoxin:NAD+ oxidoreductase RnfD subunit
MTLSLPALARPRPVVRFFRTPKGLLLILFAALIALATAAVDPKTVLPGLIGGAATAAVVDVLLARWRHEKWIVPDGALLTGLIVAMVLRPQEPLYVVVVSSAVAIGSKYLLRTHWSNVFNPAALALVASSFLFVPGQSWWGALPNLGTAGVLVLVATGGFVADRINKLPMVLVFLVTYYLLFTVASFFAPGTGVSEVFRSPDLHAALFFAFFMLDDPPTSPVRYEDQAVYAIIVAAAAYLVFMKWGALYFLPAGLLAGNAWESGRRLVLGRRASRQHHPVPAPAQPRTKQPRAAAVTQTGLDAWRRPKP